MAVLVSLPEREKVVCEADVHGVRCCGSTVGAGKARIHLDVSLRCSGYRFRSMWLRSLQERTRATDHHKDLHFMPASTQEPCQTTPAMFVLSRAAKARTSTALSLCRYAVFG